MSNRVFFAALLFVSIFMCNAEAQDVGGITVLDEPDGYPRNWALLIGVNYEELGTAKKYRRLVPRLDNAANDAKELARVLKTYYYYDDSTVTVLTDDGTHPSPTTHRIRDAVTNLYQEVQPDDSVLFFFAGHGLRIDGSGASEGDSVAILPADVELSNDVPLKTTRIDVPNELFALIEGIPARHKLVVLDCCYSGEIFNSRGRFGFQQYRGSTHREDSNLQDQKTFQAIASCRAFQSAADRPDDWGGMRIDSDVVTSKFTSAMLQALLYLPARSDRDRRVWMDRLLAYMQRNFDATQRPECRNLIGSHGEFCFYPRPPDLFESFVLRPDEQSHLKAMVVSRQGNWWFEETPWFIPSVRSEIIKQHEESRPKSRSGNFTELIEPAQLKAAAKTITKRDAAFREDARSERLEDLRVRHVDMLLTANRPGEYENVLMQIETDLSVRLLPEHVEGQENSEFAEDLEPEDLHLLAVVRHALRMKDEADSLYQKADERYEEAMKANPEGSKYILAALCAADYGEFLRTLPEPEKAADQFARARRLILPGAENAGQDAENRRQDASALFCIYLLCREADAWVSLNRWQKADELFIEARTLADSLAPNHYLQAHVRQRWAWAKMYNWQIRAASAHFESSNDILYRLISRDVHESRPGGTSTLDGSSQNVRPLETPEETGKPTERPSLIPSTSLPQAFRLSRDQAAKVVCLHNLHGMFMTMRFHGRSLEAAQCYRGLSGEVEHAISDFHDTTSDVDLELQFIMRFINTQERLGDCNLYGNPDRRDPGEAFDDYRRALGRVHLLRGDRREIQRACLLYKQALALSLPSPIQNTSLALDYCDQADLIYQVHRERAQGQWRALGELTSKVVRVLHCDHTSDVNKEEITDAVSTLREEIMAFRDEVGTAPQLDQLELSLFSSKILVEYGGERRACDLLADADLLLSFCRIALAPYRGSMKENTEPQCESQAYLRPYYDAVMRAKVNGAPGVKALLEIQHEATLGTPYVKSAIRRPLLAIYNAGDRCFLLADLPNGPSQCVDLSKEHSLGTIAYSHFHGQELRLPDSVRIAMTTWRAQQNADTPSRVDLRYDDTVRGMPNAYQELLASTSVYSTLKPLTSKVFPFQLPPGFIPNHPRDEE